ncbi:MAG: hypothetical protein K0U93_09060 [Gammaproteobacteria bacterium]|nr:hypothetical protein [Gammaproteobacteria bacterium]
MRIKLTLIAWGLAAFTVMGSAVAAEGSKREARVRQVMPVFSGMRAAIEAQFEVLAQPATATQLAAFTRNYYEALKRQGFSDGQALELVKAMGFPRLGELRR